MAKGSNEQRIRALEQAVGGLAEALAVLVPTLGARNDALKGTVAKRDPALAAELTEADESLRQAFGLIGEALQAYRPEVYRKIANSGG